MVFYDIVVAFLTTFLMNKLTITYFYHPHLLLLYSLPKTLPAPWGY